MGERARRHEATTAAWPHVPAPAREARDLSVDDQDAILVARRAGEGDAKLGAHGARPAIGTDEIARGNLLGAACGLHAGRDVRAVLGERNQLLAVLDLDAELL